MTIPPPAPSSPRAEPARLGAWIALFGALTASAGHGIFLVFALTRVHLVPSLRELGGPTNAAFVAWFVACVPLALLALFLRNPLMRSSRLGLLSAAALLTTVGAFAYYAFLIVRS